MLAAVQEDLDDATALRQQLQVASASLEARASSAEERAVRLERENCQAADRLHRQVSHLATFADTGLLSQSDAALASRCLVTFHLAGSCHGMYTSCLTITCLAERLQSKA